ncbi:MAG: hypothetical protein UW26_C0012G0003 [Candidatus Collierbacteria bacterium GW2011_GWF1_44_12]|uniref:Uncharacterized protein n=3 Tax=Candidatus Collieribacteriota TaxID=1752725 RepID=A0A0G1P9X6_9BACT|nr:MAG: hypothetical protein UW26_C0012G0003 [Candidatus Collierbacteria bacterium GW2011_GWF1_44_12]KKT99184.1 MAG: hypothetical protein UW99_C0008G0013 [Candidatus Collierbacteria bacterium GW2011_GWC2_45_15]KKU29581.1 MAG: hypothetical protein UX41_C0015G0015 [Candidatus Collierbacteria bacterium GW2011_GWE1_46_18]
MRKFLSFLPLLLLLVATPALAQNGPRPNPTKPAQVMARLSEASLRACQAREASMGKSITQLNKTTLNMLEVFNKISTRVQYYYVNTAIPAGKTISNYNTLVGEVERNRAAVSTELSAAMANGNDFSCNGDDPKGLLTQYRAHIRATKESLNAYRTSINKLIVAIRSATPAATATPTAN